jgi:hypothetical protein
MKDKGHDKFSRTEGGISQIRSIVNKSKPFFDWSVLIIQKDIIPDVDDLPAPNPKCMCAESQDEGNSDGYYFNEKTASCAHQTFHQRFRSDVSSLSDRGACGLPYPKGHCPNKKNCLHPVLDWITLE